MSATLTIAPTSMEKSFDLSEPGLGPLCADSVT